MHLCVSVRMKWIQADPRCHKSINTIEVLICPPLWAVRSFKSHLAEANLTFLPIGILSCVLRFSLWLFFFFWYLNDFLSCFHQPGLKWFTEIMQLISFDWLISFCGFSPYQPLGIWCLNDMEAISRKTVFIFGEKVIITHIFPGFLTVFSLPFFLPET